MALEMKYTYTLNYTNERMLYDDKFKKMFSSIETNIDRLIEIDKAYFMVDTITGNKDNMYFNVIIYNDATKNLIIDKKSYTFLPDTDEIAVNFIKQSYLYLKTLPEYKDAIDV